ncbi:hypothetical protein KM043_014762 [Ampulex compressa]|nr:hypothetical protein KM043_014762 [Ampulex compressa]
MLHALERRSKVPSRGVKRQRNDRVKRDKRRHKNSIGGLGLSRATRGPIELEDACREMGNGEGTELNVSGGARAISVAPDNCPFSWIRVIKATTDNPRQLESVLRLLALQE